MDPNKLLAQIRETIAAMDRPAGNTGTRYHLGVDLALLVTRLDSHLSAGGTPPEEWREGPDAVGEEPDSCEADHPTLHMQCWGSYGHESSHYFGGVTWPNADPLGGPVPGVAGSHLPEVL